MKYFQFFLLILLLLQFQEVKCQVKNSGLINGNIKTYTLLEFANKIESQTDCYFYIDPELADSFLIDLNVPEQPLDTLLDQVFKNSVVQYARDDNGYVYLTKDRKLKTSLPVDFFVNDTTTEASEDVIAVSDYLAFEKNEAISASLENKLIEIGSRTNASRDGTGNISGYVRDSRTGEPLFGVLVYTKEPVRGVSTDPFGYYSITLPLGNRLLYLKFIGSKDTKRPVALYSDGNLNIELEEKVITLKDVVVNAEKGSNILSVQIGVTRLSAKTIKRIPSLMGEADIIKIALTLPGVKSVGEASTGFNVRGGASDQNLILFNDATIYNPSHLFGFFSAINSDVVKNVELYKSGIPPKYGGRLSSILEISSRDGNEKKFTGTAGISILTSHFTIEGPILKDKTSFILCGRTSYSEWLLRQLPKTTGYSNSSASFYDLNLNIKHQFNSKNNLYFTSYLSKDQFNLSKDTLFHYENENISLKWHHVFNSKFNGVFVTGYDVYKSGNSVNTVPLSAYKFTFDVNQYYLKTDINYYVNSQNTVNFGLNFLHYQLHPGTYNPINTESLVIPDAVQTEQAIESAFYLNDQFGINEQLSLNAGIRYSVYNFLGPSKVYIYQNNMPKTFDNISDSAYFKRGGVGKTYHGAEYRVSVRYALCEDLSVKAAYNSLRQYIHLISNTTAMSPSDIWKLSDPNIRPQSGDQVNLGIYRNLRGNLIEASVEIYYKNIQNYLDYKSGALLIMNHHLETEVFTTKGKAYGIEFLLKKNSGKLNGWFSYTFSRTFLKMDDPNAGELINKGTYYPANYDKPHDFSFIGNYKFSHRYSISLNITYSTGRPITMLIGKIYYSGGFRAIYSNRNEFRIPDYFRSDLSLNIDGNHYLRQRIHSSWTFGIYNFTARRNPYSIYFITNSAGQIHGYKLSILGTAIPFVTCNLRF